MSDFLNETIERIEALAMARERNRIYALVKGLPAEGWAARRFRSHALMAISVPTVEREGKVRVGHEFG